MICVDAFKNLNIATKQGELYISPCCITPLAKVSEIKFFDDPYLSRVRKDFQENRWPRECERCRRPESQGQVSRRINSNKWYEHNCINDIEQDLIRIDYWVGDICNLACVMCGPENSSLWKQELKIPIEQRRVNRNTFWKELDLDNLQYVHFHGGEPLLSKDHDEFLRAIPNKSRVHVYYNTNGTIRADQSLLDVWNEFKLVQVDFSIDDIGDRFDYIRFPARWSEVRDNLLWYKEHCPGNCIFDIMTVVSVLNQPYLSDLADWVQENFSTNRFTDPVEHRYQPASGLLASDNPKKSEIMDYLIALDQRRGTDWKKTFPDSYDNLRS